MVHKNDQREQLLSFIKQAQEQLQAIEGEGKELLDETIEKKDEIVSFIEEHPLLATTGAFIAGWFLGRLFKRTKRK